MKKYLASNMASDVDGREYAKLSNLKPGDIVQVDDGFKGCFEPWSKLEVFEVNGELIIYHNLETCGACGGNNEEELCPHSLEGQLMDDKDSLIGIYKLEKE